MLGLGEDIAVETERASRKIKHLQEQELVENHHHSKRKYADKPKRCQNCLGREKRKKSLPEKYRIFEPFWDPALLRGELAVLETHSIVVEKHPQVVSSLAAVPVRLASHPCHGTLDERVGCIVTDAAMCSRAREDDAQL